MILPVRHPRYIEMRRVVSPSRLRDTTNEQFIKRARCL